MADVKCIKCSKCGEIKLLKEFYKRKDKKNGQHSWCKSCCNKRVGEIHAMRKYLLYNIKKYAGCAFCGTVRPQVLVFHHTNPNTKNFGIGDAHFCSLKSLFNELRKTIVLCRNCHAELHYAECAPLKGEINENGN